MNYLVKLLYNLRIKYHLQKQELRHCLNYVKKIINQFINGHRNVSGEKMDELIKRLKQSVEFAEKNGEDMDDVSWGMQEGVLISYNEAKKIIALANKPKVILVGNSHISSAEIVKELNDRGLGCLVIGAPEEKDHNTIFRNPAFEPPPIPYERMPNQEELKTIQKPAKNYIDGTRKLPRRNKQ